jgi:hypothetical protein
MNRRDFLTGAAAVAACLPLARIFGDEAIAQGATRFSRIVVDTGPLSARGGHGVAAIIAPRLSGSLARELAGRIGGRGPALVARVHTVNLAPFNTGADRGGVPSDYLEGEVIAGELRFPLLVTQPSNIAGRGYLSENEVQRIHYLADAFANWIRRRV